MSTSGKVLKLQLNDNILSPYSNDSITEEGIVEWVVGQDYYSVEISCDKKYLIYNLVINNIKNEPIESILMNSKKDSQGNIVYTAKSTIAKFLKSGSKIFLGVCYQENTSKTTKNNFSSTPLPIILKSSINNYVDPADLKVNFSVATELLKKFDSAKAVKALKIEKNTKTQAYDLYVEYVGSTSKEKVGQVTPSVEDLGLVIKRQSKKGGGGQVGDSAALEGSVQSGFCGGYGAKTGTGAAVGEGAYSASGFAGGRYASAKAGGSIAIGYESDVYQNSSSGIAVGTGSLNRDGTAAIAIGRYSVSYASSHSVVIGSTNFDKDTNIKYITNRVDDNKNQLPPLATQTRATSSPRAVVIGYRAYAVRTADTIVIGNSASSRAPENKTNKYCISVGYMSITRNNSCISIGPDSKAGTTYYGLQISGNQAEEENAKGFGHVSAIAIGRGAWARRHSCVALGKHTNALQHGCIAIGHHSVAGDSKKLYESKPSSEETSGSRSVAIGWRANATATNSVQLGSGTNSIENSLQFMGVTVVKDKAVQVNLSGKGLSGTLPLKKGGTGATTAVAARKNLGIYYGTQAVKNLAVSSLSSTGKNITVTFPKDIKFSSPPQVIANLSFGSDDYDPSCHHFFIKSISKTGFVLRYNYSGTSGSAKKNFNINYIAMV